MLMSPVSRASREALVSRWNRLGAWLIDPANAGAANVRAAIAPAQARWGAMDKGLLSNTADIPDAWRDLQSAEAMAATVGYTVRTAGGPDEDITMALVDPVGTAINIATGGVPNVVPDVTSMAAGAMNDWCKQNPDNIACKVTDPDTTTCGKLGIPEWLGCGGDLPWWMWAFGAGAAATLGLIVYASYKAATTAAPYALAYYAPEALPAYQAMRRQKEAA
jgi:hypothetical protein